MNTNIQNLIDKYYSGKTSLDEEKYLRNALSSEETTQDNNYNKLIFNTFEEEKTETAPLALKTFSPVTHTPRKFTFYRKKWLYLTSGMAACLLIALGMFFYHQEEKNTAYVIIDGVRINDEQLAIEYVNKQFAEISRKIDESLEPLYKIEEKEREIKEKLKFITNKYY
jgi:hypothetical protein